MAFSGVTDEHTNTGKNVECWGDLGFLLDSKTLSVR
jgi:hypothetical protein